MTVAEFIRYVEEIAAEKPTYKLGKDGSNGECDCVGLIIGAMRRAGVRYDDLHGSNWFARYHTDSLMRISGADDLSLGDIVYKAKAPGESGYDLPSRYAKDPDQRDYYHIGVVTSVNPLRITHCTQGGGVDGITTDSKLGKWTYKGQLSVLAAAADDEQEEVEVMTSAVVTAVSGSTVNMRKQPDARADLVDRVPIGSVVQVVSIGTMWAEVIWSDRKGYMMRSFLQLDEASHENPSDDQTGTLDAWQTDIEERLSAVEEALARLAERVSGMEGGAG